ncbi:7SK snRNA methylphosphate capping enzyme isoform X2 [Scleropages formosus]|nr:7SK snRNA methylphosphate capping enzyme isoform X2 [Scleropages formosus]
MIEMSVEKETVLPDNGRVDPVVHLQPQPSAECIESCSRGPRTVPAALETSGSSDTPSAGAAATFVGSLTLTEKQASNGKSTSDCGRTVSMELDAKVTGAPFQPKNGLQSSRQQRPPQQQQQQQQHPRQQQQVPQSQKLSKRRSTMSAGFKHPGFGKRRRRANSESDPVLPTNFLLGGNIFDPLNLNSLLDEEVNRAINAETPKSSPLPAKSRDPVEILIPRDITDPLNLNSTRSDAGILASPIKSGGRKRHRNRHHGGGGNAVMALADPLEPEKFKAGDVCSTTSSGGVSSSVPLPTVSAMGDGLVAEAFGEGAILLNLTPVQESPRPYELNTILNCRDVIVPPILPRSHQTPAALTSQSQSTGESASCSASGNHASRFPNARQRKRRRASSKSEPSAVTPSPSMKKWGGEKGQRPGPGPAKQPQTFHTPASSTGVGVPVGRPQIQNQRKHQKKFQYGNYNKYYGYRNPGWSEDPRMRVLKPEWFQGKTVLDLGCNTGHLTLSIAKNWRPLQIVGLDIDGALVHAARQNIRHYLSEVQTQEARRAAREGQVGTCGWHKEKERVSEEEMKSDKLIKEVDKMEDGEDAKREVGEEIVKDAELPVFVESRDEQEEGTEKMDGRESSKRSKGPLADTVGVDHPFPVSLRISRGPIAAPPLPEMLPERPGDFPGNVSFVRGNYVLENDALLHAQKPEYDIILCLSVTKWVHLNWGDAGLQRLFQRVYRHLRPGGLFILEPQPWASYGKRKKLTDTIFRNYHNIRFRPDQFSTYLTSEVGFSSYELVGTPKSSSRGFQRPIYLFHKGPSSQRK